MKLVTDDKDVHKEYKRLGLTELELDSETTLIEIKSHEITTAKYKAYYAGKGTITESSILHYNNEQDILEEQELITNIDKYVGYEVKWTILLGVNDGVDIKLYRGTVQGTIVKPTVEPLKGEGFEAYFVPYGSMYTLAELEEKGLKDEYSARNKAVYLYQNNFYSYIQNVLTLSQQGGTTNV